MRNFATVLYDRFSTPTSPLALWTTTWVDETEGLYDQLLFNNLVIETACFYGVERCLEHAGQKFVEWRALGATDPSETPGFGPDATDGNTVQSRSLVLCYGVRGDPSTENWDHLRQLYGLATTTTSNKLTILRALACTKHEDLLQKVLLMTTDNVSIRPQDASSVFTYLVRYPTGATLAWDFVRSEWSKLTRRTTIVSAVAGLFKDDWRLTQLRALYATAGTASSEAPTFVSTIARVEANILWTAAHATNLAAFLTNLTPVAPENVIGMRCYNGSC